MLFDEYSEPFQVWRMVASGYMTDPTWTFITTVFGRAEPVAGTEEFLNNQSFADVSEIFYLPLSYKGIIFPTDGIVDVDGVQRRVVGEVEIWKHILPHLACKLERAQWTVVS